MSIFSRHQNLIECKIGHAWTQLGHCNGGRHQPTILESFALGHRRKKCSRFDVSTWGRLKSGIPVGFYSQVKMFQMDLCFHSNSRLRNRLTNVKREKNDSFDVIQNFSQNGCGGGTTYGIAGRRGFWEWKSPWITGSTFHGDYFDVCKLRLRSFKLWHLLQEFVKLHPGDAICFILRVLTLILTILYYLPFTSFYDSSSINYRTFIIGKIYSFEKEYLHIFRSFHECCSVLSTSPRDNLS